jgi:hypothetical protein
MTLQMPLLEAITLVVAITIMFAFALWLDREDD